MLKRYGFWVKAVGITQLLTAAIHSLSFLSSPTPQNPIEQKLFELMDTYHRDLGAGFDPSVNDLMTALSACFAFLYLFGGLVNLYLLRREVGIEVMKGLLGINLLVFGPCFVVMMFFTFLPPIVLTGAVFLLLVVAAVVLSRNRVQAAV